MTCGPERPLQMPPVIGGAGSDGGKPSQKRETLPPVINGSGGDGNLPTERPLQLPPVI